MPNFSRPLWFAALLIPIMVMLWYAVRERRNNKKTGVILDNETSLLSVVPDRPRKRRHVVPVLIFMACCLGVVVAANPVRTMRVVDDRATVMIVLDVSRSMQTEDVSPNRMDAARTVLRDLLQPGEGEGIPEDLNVGLVTFADNAEAVVPPTRNRELLLEELDAIVPKLHGTRTGEGVMRAVEAFETFDVPSEAGQIYLISDGAESRPVQGFSTLPDATTTVDTKGYTLNAVAYGTETGSLDGTAYPPDFSSLEIAATATGGWAEEAPTAEKLSQTLSSIPSGLDYDEFEVMHDLAVTILVATMVGLLLLAVCLGIAWSGWFH